MLPVLVLELTKAANHGEVAELKRTQSTMELHAKVLLIVLKTVLHVLSTHVEEQHTSSVLLDPRCAIAGCHSTYTIRLDEVHDACITGVQLIQVVLSQSRSCRHAYLEVNKFHRCLRFMPSIDNQTRLAHVRGCG